MSMSSIGNGAGNMVAKGWARTAFAEARSAARSACANTVTDIQNVASNIFERPFSCEDAVGYIELQDCLLRQPLR